jgi:hypothetical protein
VAITEATIAATEVPLGVESCPEVIDNGESFALPDLFHKSDPR